MRLTAIAVALGLIGIAGLLALPKQYSESFDIELYGNVTQAWKCGQGQCIKLSTQLELVTSAGSDLKGQEIFAKVRFFGRKGRAEVVCLSC